MIDQLIIGFDRALRTVFANAHTVRPVPGESRPEAEMSEEERRHAAALMRVNHCGEICAQALYQGQALMSDNEGIKKALAGAAKDGFLKRCYREAGLTAECEAKALSRFRCRCSTGAGWPTRSPATTPW